MMNKNDVQIPGGNPGMMNRDTGYFVGIAGTGLPGIPTL